MSGDAKRFLESIFRDAPAGSRITISGPVPGEGLLSKHADGTDEAAEAAGVFDSGQINSYVSLAARRDGLEPRQRGAMVDLLGAGCIWLDLDVGAAGHASKTCLPDEDAAAELLAAMPQAPSVVVSTGGGFHLYWLFDAWCDSSARVEQLCRKWQGVAREWAAARGWSVDDTGDAPRMLRVPGTTNYKIPGNPRPVALEMGDEPPRYSLVDLERAVGDRPAVVAVTQVDPGPPAEVSLADLRRCLSDARRRKAQGDERKKEQAALLGRVLEGEPLAKKGERDNTILRASGLIAYWCPAGTPWAPVRELLRPSISAMLEAEPDERGVEFMLGVAEKKYEKQARSRAAADAATSAIVERTRAAIRAATERPMAEVAENLGDAWTDLLLEVGKNGPKVCEANAVTLLSCAPELRGTIRWNDVTKRIEITGGPLAGESEATLDVAAAAHLQKTHSFWANSNLVGRALLKVARSNSYDPIAEYLGELAWDGVERISSFLGDRCGALMQSESGEDISEHVRRISRMWMIGLVARGLQPGCQMDNVLVLEGLQGIRKTSLMRALGGLWFCETEISLGDKDWKQLVSTSWLIELGEMASLLGAETSRAKLLITSVEDMFRLPYGKVTEKFPRRCVLVGTINPEEGQGYLTDRTGNRRYWPVRLADTEIDADAIKADRDQLLAEAVEAFRAGERWWLTRDEAEIAERQTAERMRAPKYRDLIYRWWAGLPSTPPRVLTPGAAAGLWRGSDFTLDDVADKALMLPADRVESAIRRDIGYSLRELGFIREREGGGLRMWKYRAPTDKSGEPRLNQITDTYARPSGGQN